MQPIRWLHFVYVSPPQRVVAQRSSFPCQRESSVGLNGFLRARVLQNANLFRPRSHAPAWECIEGVTEYAFACSDTAVPLTSQKNGLTLPKMVQ